jgi:hypothetical protein
MHGVHVLRSWALPVAAAGFLAVSVLQIAKSFGSVVVDERAIIAAGGIGVAAGVLAAVAALDGRAWGALARALSVVGSLVLVGPPLGWYAFAPIAGLTIGMMVAAARLGETASQRVSSVVAVIAAVCAIVAMFVPVLWAMSLIDAAWVIVGVAALAAVTGEQRASVARFVRRLWVSADIR